MKVILILILYVQGIAQGQYTPAPAFETMEECVVFYNENREAAAVPGGDTRAVCISETEVKELR